MLFTRSLLRASLSCLVDGERVQQLSSLSIISVARWQGLGRLDLLGSASPIGLGRINGFGRHVWAQGQ